MAKRKGKKSFEIILQKSPRDRGVRFRQSVEDWQENGRNED